MLSIYTISNRFRVICISKVLPLFSGLTTISRSPSRYCTTTTHWLRTVVRSSLAHKLNGNVAHGNTQKCIAACCGPLLENPWHSPRFVILSILARIMRKRKHWLVRVAHFALWEHFHWIVWIYCIKSCKNKWQTRLLHWFAFVSSRICCILFVRLAIIIRIVDKGKHRFVRILLVDACGTLRLVEALPMDLLTLSATIALESACAAHEKRRREGAGLLTIRVRALANDEWIHFGGHILELSMVIGFQDDSRQPATRAHTHKKKKTKWSLWCVCARRTRKCWEQCVILQAIIRVTSTLECDKKFRFGGRNLDSVVIGLILKAHRKYAGVEAGVLFDTKDV